MTYKKKRKKRGDHIHSHTKNTPYPSKFNQTPVRTSQIYIPKHTHHHIHPKYIQNQHKSQKTKK